MKLHGRIIKVLAAFVASLLLTWVVEAAVFGHPGLLMRIAPKDLNPFNSWIEIESEEKEVAIVHEGAKKPMPNYQVINDLNPFLSWIDSFRGSGEELGIQELEEEEEILVVHRGEAKKQKEYMAIRKFLL